MTAILPCLSAQPFPSSLHIIHQFIAKPAVQSPVSLVYGLLLRYTSTVTVTVTVTEEKKNAPQTTNNRSSYSRRLQIRSLQRRSQGKTKDGYSKDQPSWCEREDCCRPSTRTRTWTWTRTRTWTCTHTRTHTRTQPWPSISIYCECHQCSSGSISMFPISDRQTLVYQSCVIKSAANATCRSPGQICR